jgi:hypothetical protein
VWSGRASATKGTIAVLCFDVSIAVFVIITANPGSIAPALGVDLVLEIAMHKPVISVLGLHRHTSLPDGDVANKRVKSIRVLRISASPSLPKRP